MINIAICDDNKAMLDYLSREIGECFQEALVNTKISSFDSGKAFVLSHRSTPFDVVFLDIVMPDINGFDVAKIVPQISDETYIIFITTENNLVYDSFDFQPFNFIPKGKTHILEQKLKQVIEKLIIHISAREKVFINGALDSKHYVSPMEILYIKSNVNNAEFHLKSDTEYVRCKLDIIFSSLNHYIFARPHNRFIVNMKHIKRINFPTCEILLDNGETLPISRGYKKIFEQEYIQFTRNFI